MKARTRATSKRTWPTRGLRSATAYCAASRRSPATCSTPILRDGVPDERQLGIEAGLAWRFVAEASVVYQDLGITPGMRRGIEAAETAGVPVEYRNLASFGTQKGRAESSPRVPWETW